MLLSSKIFITWLCPSSTSMNSSLFKGIYFNCKFTTCFFLQQIVHPIQKITKTKSAIITINTTGEVFPDALSVRTVREELLTETLFFFLRLEQLSLTIILDFLLQIYKCFLPQLVGFQPDLSDLLSIVMHFCLPLTFEKFRYLILVRSNHLYLRPFLAIPSQ
jgi:hypothetical protein